MGIESERYEKRTEKVRLTKTSCMSNAKWRKLFTAIETNGKCSFPSKLKVLAEDRTYPFSTNPGIHESANYTGGPRKTLIKHKPRSSPQIFGYIGLNMEHVPSLLFLRLGLFSCFPVIPGKWADYPL